GEGTVGGATRAPGAGARPAVSPDGKQIAFAGYAPSGKTHTVSDLYVAPIDGGTMKKISGDLDRDPINPRWAPDGSGVYFDAQDRGSQNVYFASTTGGTPRVVTQGAHILSFDSMSKDLVAAGTETDPDHPQDVVTYSLKGASEPTKLTDVNGDLLAGKQLAKTEEIWYTSTNGTKVQGWIVKPPS